VTTLLAHALALLLGGRPRAGIVRPGAAEAYVEGVFTLTPELREHLGDRLAEDADELVLARRVSAEGRTRAYLGGRTATAADLRDVGASLLSFYGQHEHRRLTLASSQLEILDGFCGPAHTRRRAEFAAAYAAERALAAEQEALRARAGARDRELDLLEWELGEIEAAAPRADEEAELAAERSRLRNLEGLRLAAAGGMEALAPDEGGGVAAALAGTARAFDAVRGVDPALDALADRAVGLSVEAEDLAGELRRYGETVDAPPGRLDEVEERLAVYERLKRKHGGTVEAVLAHAAECRERRDALAGADAALAAGAARLEAASAPPCCARRASRPRHGSAAPSARRSPVSPWRGRSSRRSCRSAPSTGRPAATRWSSSSRRTPACRRGRSARSPRAGSCRA
jgi:DNA repair protein RecN (Recombination protein N)